MCFQPSICQRNTCLQPGLWPLKASSFPAWLGALTALAGPSPRAASGAGARSREPRHQPAELQKLRIAHLICTACSEKTEKKNISVEHSGRSAKRKVKVPDRELACASSDASHCPDKVQSHQVSGCLSATQQSAKCPSRSDHHQILGLPILKAHGSEFHRLQPANSSQAFPNKTFLRPRLIHFGFFFFFFA